MKFHSAVSALVELMTTSNGGLQNRTVSALRQPYHTTCEAGHIVLEFKYSSSNFPVQGHQASSIYIYYQDQ